jgi:hypothetical protein
LFGRDIGEQRRTVGSERAEGAAGHWIKCSVARPQPVVHGHVTGRQFLNAAPLVFEPLASMVTATPGRVLSRAPAMRSASGSLSHAVEMRPEASGAGQDPVPACDIGQQLHGLHSSIRGPAIPITRKLGEIHAGREANYPKEIMATPKVVALFASLLPSLMLILNAHGDTKAALDRTRIQRSSGLLAILEGPPEQLNSGQRFKGG